MTDIQQTWLNKEACMHYANGVESREDSDFEMGAKALQNKLYNWVEHIEQEGVASPYVLSAMWELVEQIQTWCGNAK